MNEVSIKDFRDWLINRGRTEETAEGYAADVSLALTHPQGPLGRLRMKSLAPKTLRRILAALRAWCKFAKDSVLLDQLMDIRLPPPERVTVKSPFTKDEWHKIISEIFNADYLENAEKVALGIIAMRGLRVGDVLRMEREKLSESKLSGMLMYLGKGSKWMQVDVKTFKQFLDLLDTETDSWDYIRDLISTSNRGNKQKSASQQLSRQLKVVAKKCGISPKSMHLHKLRRTYATFFLKAVNGDLERLKQRMGWADIATAAKYVDHDKREELERIGETLFKEDE